MFWADNEVGLPNLFVSLKKFARQFPETDHFVPSKLLETCAGLGVTCEEYYSKGMHKQGHSRL